MFDREATESPIMKFERDELKDVLKNMTTSNDKDSVSSLQTDKSMKKFDIMKSENEFEGELSDGPEPQVEPDNCSKLPQKLTRNEMIDK